MATIKGTVTDASGTGIQDATVTITESGSDTLEGETTTDASGEYSANVAADTYDVRASKFGYEPVEKPSLVVNSGATVTVDLSTSRVEYKIRGQFTNTYGIGVLGRNTAASGLPIGVLGAAPNASDGYGLATPDDTLVEGDLDATSGHTLTVAGDRVMRLAPAGTDTNDSGVTYGIGGSVVGGYVGNDVNGSLGAMIGGGGGATTKDSSGRVLAGPNEVTDRFGTVGGGSNNRAGNAQSGTEDAMYATVSGGNTNTASHRGATVAGGVGNTASGGDATVSGGTRNTASANSATVAGGLNNTASANSATVAGGLNNTASANSATVAGGNQNTASDNLATVGGGLNNITSGSQSTVAGGFSNTASGRQSTVGGGYFNDARGTNSTVGGGGANRTGKSGTSKGEFATVPGGQNAVARENYSFAAGRQAEAFAQGAFVWGDSSTDTVQSLTDDEVVFQAGGGAVVWTTSDFSSGVELAPGDSSWSSVSSRSAKSAIQPVDPGEVLAGVEALEVSTWEYDTREGVTHMGPMAADFEEAFGLGGDPERISTVDADGVLFAALQGLSDKLDEKQERIDDLEDESERKNDRIDTLEEENERLHDRLATVEDHLGLTGTTDRAPEDD
ncbi:hypothetical protein DJ82_03755 [Halorubrum sp. Ib24]|uniref:carboxypeptidase regulatory-like domain-containing protein n=1 Tax=Halorubrum sp. Ib24 TaxID=1383850 RepID=UPI000B993521|nr:carboxypeptidase regulatory-like domain-containing protein [Halorubrum sp. Ib24]OYR41997.1 hypothetical protein DJ82_03755 [Halorubrum sp. Ib24]